MSKKTARKVAIILAIVLAGAMLISPLVYLFIK